MTYSLTVPLINQFTYRINQWNMLLLITNTLIETVDAYNKTFESTEVTCFITHTQGLPSISTIYKTCEKQYHSHIPTLTLRLGAQK